MRPGEFYSPAARKGVNCASDLPQPITSSVTPSSTYIYTPSEPSKASQTPKTPLKPGPLFDGLAINMEEPRSETDESEHEEQSLEPAGEEGSGIVSHEPPQDMRKYYNSKTHTDMILRLSDGTSIAEMPVHKIVLVGHSGFFHRVLEEDLPKDKPIRDLNLDSAQTDGIRVSAMQVVLRYLYGYNGDMTAEVDTDDLNISFILHIDRAITKLEVPARQSWAPMVAGRLLRSLCTEPDQPASASEQLIQAIVDAYEEHGGSAQLCCPAIRKVAAEFCREHPEHFEGQEAFHAAVDKYPQLGADIVSANRRMAHDSMGE